jgi:aldose 1-epimerase
MNVFTLARGGLTAEISTFGAKIVTLRVADGTNIVLGYPTLADYQADEHFMGGVIGRYANRIANARFPLDGIEHHVTANDGPNHLHGGARGFHRVDWRVLEVSGTDIELGYFSREWEEGYPGNLTVSVRYSITEEGDLRTDLFAVTDRATVVNLTTHPYFNLAGSGTILGHELQIEADHYLPVDAGLIPTGEIAAVEGTEFDFRTARLIARGDYDHNFVLRAAGGLGCAARLCDPTSNRTLEIFTTEPGLQLYTGQHLAEPNFGLCLEPQHFPDSPNRSEFPSTRLNAGIPYRTTTLVRCGAPDTRLKKVSGSVGFCRT